jgi:hypothetical protein
MSRMRAGQQAGQCGALSGGHVRNGCAEVRFILGAGVLGLEQQDQFGCQVRDAVRVAGSRSQVWWVAASTTGAAFSQIRPLLTASKMYPGNRSRTSGKRRGEPGQEPRDLAGSSGMTTWHRELRSRKATT